MSDLLKVLKDAHRAIKSNLEMAIDVLKTDFDGGYEVREAEKLIKSYIKEQYNIDVKVGLSPNYESLDLAFSDIDDYTIVIEGQNEETVYENTYASLESDLVSDLVIEIDEACRRYVVENGDKI